jgi:hypothetical protein
MTTPRSGNDSTLANSGRIMFAVIGFFAIKADQWFFALEPSSSVMAGPNLVSFR